MTNLARLSDVKAGMTGLTGTTAADGAILSLTSEVSSEFERATGREFRATLGTWYLAGNCRKPYDLRLPFDLVSITSLKWASVTPGTYGVTLVEDTDFFVVRLDDDENKPITKLEINPNSTLIAAWPTARRALELVGMRGYNYELESTGLTLGSNMSDSDATLTTSASANTLIYPGDTLVIDDEQFEVTAVNNTTVTANRAINGTTAAAHTTADTLYVRRYPREVEEIVRERVAMRRWDQNMGYGGGSPTMEEMAQTSAIRQARARWFSTVDAYKRNWGLA